MYEEEQHEECEAQHDDADHALSTPICSGLHVRRDRCLKLRDIILEAYKEHEAEMAAVA